MGRTTHQNALVLVLLNDKALSLNASAVPPEYHDINPRGKLRCVIRQFASPAD